MRVGVHRLLERGYYVAPRGYLALSLAVTPEQLDGFVGAVGDAVRQRAALWPVVGAG